MASSNSGNRCPYRSSVMLIDEWPIRDWMALGCAPAAIANATLVWRRSWKRHAIPARACARAKWLDKKLDDDSGLPAPFVNTSASGVVFVIMSKCPDSNPAVNGEIVIDRTPADVFGSLRRNEPSASRTS